MNHSLFAAIALSCATIVPLCHGSLLINITGSATEVNLFGTGRVNTAGLTAIGTGTGQGFLRGTSSPAMVVGSGALTSLEIWSGVFGPNIGSSSTFHIPSSGSGDVFGVDGGSLYLPIGYVSGSPLGGTSQYSGQSIDSLGLTRGIYTFSWGSGPTADSITLNIGVVPEPSETLAVVGATCLGAALLRRRFRR